MIRRSVRSVRSAWSFWKIGIWLEDSGALLDYVSNLLKYWVKVKIMWECNGSDITFRVKPVHLYRQRMQDPELDLLRFTGMIIRHVLRRT